MERKGTNRPNSWQFTASFLIFTTICFYCVLAATCVLQVIPVYEEDSQFQPSAIEMVDGQTSPPQLLTEADLISLMEKHGIGKLYICQSQSFVNF